MPRATNQPQLMFGPELRFDVVRSLMKRTLTNPILLWQACWSPGACLR
jgi:hypothetical protein